MENIELIHIARLVPSASNPRKKTDKAKLEELKDSIVCFGILSPILVRPKSEARFEIINGHRRVDAAKLAEIVEIPAIVRNLTDDDALEIQLVDNIQRADIDPLDEADCFHQMVKQLKLTVETIAARIGKPRAYVTNRMKLIDLIPAWRDHYASGKAPLGVVQLIARQTQVDQEKLLKDMKYNLENEGTLTLEEVRDEIERNFHLELSRAGFPKRDPLLYPEAGSCEECPKRTGFNKDLFNDVGKADRCTDSACYNEKADLFLRIQVEKNPDLQKLSAKSNWGMRARVEGKPIPENLYRKPDGDQKKNKEKGLLVDGPSRGRTVEFIYTGESPESAEHAQEVKERAKKQSAKEKAQFDFRDRVAEKLREAFIEGAPTEFDIKDLREFAIWFSDAVTYEVKPPNLQKASAGELIQFLLSAYAISAIEDGDNDYALEIAKRWKINVKGIQEEVRKEMEAEATEAKDKKPAKKVKS